jgi:hypothetical protein
MPVSACRPTPRMLALAMRFVAPHLLGAFCVALLGLACAGTPDGSGDAGDGADASGMVRDGGVASSSSSTAQSASDPGGRSSSTPVPGSSSAWASSSTGAGSSLTAASSNAEPLDAGSTDDAAGAVDAAVEDAGTEEEDGGRDAGGTADARWVMPPRDVCPGNYAQPVRAGALQEPALVETSGVVASPTVDGLLWMHNDSGDNARVFGMGTQGEALGTLLIPEVLVDLEDIAAAPCPDGLGPCLWLADTGNNALDRTDLSVVAVLEPPLSDATPFGQLSATVTWRFPVQYPEGVNVDSEALVVTPDGAEVFVFEKVDGAQSRMFGAPAPSVDGEPLVFTEVGRFTAPGVGLVAHGKDITAADLHPTGTRLVMRVYTGVYEWRFAAGATVRDLPSLGASVVTLGPFTEQQGEAVAYDHAGTGLFTVSEDRNQMPGQPLNRYACP